MRRTVPLLLTLLLALASFATAGHAVPHASGHVAHAHTPEAGKHVAMQESATTSCCTGETQRAVSSCHTVATLPATDAGDVPSRVAGTVVFASGDVRADGIDLEGPLDPPRA